MEKSQGDARKAQTKNETLALKTADFQKRTMQEAIDSGQIFRDMRKEQRIETLEKKSGKGDGKNLVEEFKKGFTNFLDKGNEAIYHPGKTVDRLLTGAFGMLAKPFQAMADARKRGAEKAAAEEQAKLTADYQKQLDDINEKREIAHQDRAFAFYDELLTKHFGDQSKEEAPSGEGEEEPINTVEPVEDETAASFMGRYESPTQLMLPPPMDLVPAGGAGAGAMFGDMGMSPADFFLWLFDTYFTDLKDFFVSPDSSVLGRFLTGLFEGGGGAFGGDEEARAGKGSKSGLDLGTLAVIAMAIAALVAIVSMLAPGLNALLTGMGTFIATIAPGILEILKAIAGAIVVLAPIVAEALKAIVELFIALTPYIVELVGIMTKLVGIIADIIGKVLQSIYEIFVEIKPYLVRFLQKGLELLIAVANFLINVLGEAFKIVSGVSGTVQGGLDVVNAVTSGIKAVIGTVLDEIVKVLNDIFKFFNTTMKTVFDALTTGINLMVGALLAALTSIVGAISYMSTFLSTGGDWKRANYESEQSKGRVFNYVLSENGAQAKAMSVFDGSLPAAGASVITMRGANIDEQRARGDVLSGNQDAGVNKAARTADIKKREAQYYDNLDRQAISKTENNITNVYSTQMPKSAQH
jgi:hypothetical protein